MSEYQRFVSYLYGYVQGEKKESAGFVRVNVRGSACRIHIHLRGQYLREQKPYQVYLFKKEEGRPGGVLIGELRNQGGALEWDGAVSADSLIDGRFCFQESDGIYIEGSSRIYAAGWNGEPVEAGRFAVLETEAEPEKAPEPEEVLEVEEAPEPELLMAAEELAAEELAAEEPEQERPEQERPEQEKAEPEEDSRWERWEYLTNHFPVMRCSTGDDTILCSIRLSARELMGIPRNHWELGSNSFLLHGCCRYGHLLLLRHQKKQKVRYLVGVPGIYHEREQALASMFGFEEFKVIRGPGARSGGMGYWCKTLE